MNKINIWENTIHQSNAYTTVDVYITKNKTSDVAMIIFPGGGYRYREPLEAEPYAKFFNDNGITAFVCNYRVNPDEFPNPLLDARRTIQNVRSMANKLGINKEKIVVMGSSAGGHLAALCATYTKAIKGELEDEIGKESFIPNGQVLCYPVIKLLNAKDGAHIGSCDKLLGTRALELGDKLNPEYLVTKNTPPCFAWHTYGDTNVSVMNTICYAQSLKQKNVSAEIHLFPDGRHGLGMCIDCENEKPKVYDHVSQWKPLLLNWLEYTFG